MSFGARSLARAALSAALVCAAAAGGLSFAQGQSQGAAEAGGEWARLEEVAARVLREGEVPGAAVALVRGGRVVWRKGFGVKNARTKEPVDDSTVFEAASLSKPVFAYAVLKLAEQGKLDLDAPLSKHLPTPFVENDERLNLVTARMVLSHRTGFPNWRPGGQPLKIHFAPGQRFSYSGEGFVYLQKVVERLTGEPLDAFMRRTVFAPLGMSRSSYVWRDEYETLKAHAHDEAGGVAGRNQPREANAAASLQTTAEDYARFVAAVLRGEGLKGETAREMLRAQVWVNEGCGVVCLNPEGAPRQSQAIAWGLGWGLQRTGDGETFWHWGDNGNVKAYVVASKKKRRGLVFFANSANGLSVVHEIVAEVFGAQQPALAWLDYERYDAPTRMVLRQVLAKGATLTEAQANRLGYRLLARGRAKEAIEVFRLNVERFPKSSNAYDSLGEAYLKAGERESAEANYRKAFELNPKGSKSAMLKRLETKVGEDFLKAYEGEYEAPFGVLRVWREGTRLFGEAEGTPKEELLPESETQFYAVGPNMTVVFVKSETGAVTHLLLRGRGEEMRAKKIK
ncbi:MAG TPA: serine hydrolase [Pyrinomonadaceae bacterium]|nr:serine hydrolase [Pyrinomonadaceae bacterium]